MRTQPETVRAVVSATPQAVSRRPVTRFAGIQAWQVPPLCVRPVHPTVPQPHLQATAAPNINSRTAVINPLHHNCGSGVCIPAFHRKIKGDKYFKSGDVFEIIDLRSIAVNVSPENYDISRDRNDTCEERAQLGAAPRLLSPIRGVVTLQRRHELGVRALLKPSYWLHRRFSTARRRLRISRWSHLAASQSFPPRDRADPATLGGPHRAEVPFPRCRLLRIANSAGGFMVVVRFSY